MFLSCKIDPFHESAEHYAPLCSGPVNLLIDQNQKTKPNPAIAKCQKLFKKF
jgi:hypothetical protein